jgi:hypothetical protein
LAALALTIQALSAVYASGAPPAGAHGRVDAAYCEAFGGSDRRAPISGHRDAGACLVCQGCLGGFSPFLPLSGAVQSRNPRNVAEADWIPGATAGLGFGLAHAHRARAPPAFS